MGAELSITQPLTGSCLRGGKCVGSEVIVEGPQPEAARKPTCVVSEECIGEEDVDSTLSTVSPQSSSDSLHSRTVLAFDWDDTLLCSSALRSQNPTKAQLKELEVAVEGILRAGMALGETLIVTNGNKSWVQDSARCYLPGLLPLLSELEVVSARALYEDAYPGDPFKWKKCAFEKCFIQDRHIPSEPGVNLVALGDQHPELDAAHHVTQLIGGGSLVKTVKFREAPSLPELIGELGRAEESLAEIVSAGKSMSYGLVPRALPPCFDHVMSNSTAWSCLSKEEAVQGHKKSKDKIINIKGMLSILA